LQKADRPHLRIVRNYSQSHDHGKDKGHGKDQGHGKDHGGYGSHAPPSKSVEIQELEEDTQGYYMKYYGHLSEPKNKPDDFWALTLLKSDGVLECLAEINSSEFKMGKIEVNSLQGKYKEQLGIDFWRKSPK